ncbi:MAG TPA: 1-acyl-sn-glycerol-3-phosphate acyltransferase [Anaerolineales bacterium]|nr:1-acyl-sn-glycerol-3-phosphate acyltransferase [Anaerolineales bacterium]
MTSQYDTLLKINLDDLVSSFGWEDKPILPRILQQVFLKPAQTFARQMNAFDTEVGKSGLVEGARFALRKYFNDIRIFGSGNIPGSGFLAVSNHPGMSDTLSTFIALDRRELKIIALQRPFLEALTNVSKQLFYVTDDPASRMNLVRQVSTHLRNGGRVLTYPAGEIEPDPDVHTDAVESLNTWMDSVGVFIRMAPETPILPILVRGVVWKKALNHPLTRIRRTRMEREQLAAALQVFAYMRGKIHEGRVRVQIGNPIYSKQLGTTETKIIHQAVLAEMKRLIENPPVDEGVSAL